MAKTDILILGMRYYSDFIIKLTYAKQIMPIETELKLIISPNDINKLEQHPLLQSAIHTRKSQHLHNIYFDSTEHDLLQLGIGLRVRHIGNQRLQTLKTAGNTHGGLHQRQEWEMPITADTPNYSQFPPGALPNWCIDKNNLAKIKPLFVTNFERVTWQVILEDGSKIEVALDQGIIENSTNSIPLSEVELELKAGTADKLYQVALALQETIPLSIENKSKAAHGYALNEPNIPKYHLAKTVDLNINMTNEQAFSHIIWHCLNHLQANENMVLHGEDIEGVHQMWVALQRLGSCLSLYNSLIPKKTHADLRQQIKLITNNLGVARDWDVFAVTIQHIMHHNFVDNCLDDLLITVVDKQSQVYATVRNVLRSSNYTRMQLSLGNWLTQRQWRHTLDAAAQRNLEMPVLNFANQVLESCYQTTKTLISNFTQFDQEQLHNLRIAIKKFVDGVQFFTELYPNDQVHPYAKVLVRLHNELDIINDSNVATNQLQQDNIAKDVPAQYFLKGWFAHQQTAHLADLKIIWQTFFDQPTFWNDSIESKNS